MVAKKNYSAPGFPAEGSVVSIGDLCARVENIDPGLFAEELSEFFGPFACCQEPDLVLRISRAERSPGPVMDDRLVTEQWESLHRFPFEELKENVFRLRVMMLRAFMNEPRARAAYSRALDEGLDRTAIFLSGLGPVFYFPESGLAELFVASDMKPSHFEPQVKAAVFQVFTAALADREGLLVHGSAIEAGGFGSAFLGLSGAGKTTSGRVSGRPLFADDGIALRNPGDGFRVYATPFCQQRERPEWAEGVRIGSAPLAGLYFLEKSGENRLDPMPVPEAAVLILQHLIHYFRLFPAALAEKAFRTTGELLRRVPSWRLHFRKDGGFTELLKTAK